MIYNTLAFTTPILCPCNDVFYGQTPDGWMLYETPDGLPYLAKERPPVQGYILPVSEAHRARLIALARRFTEGGKHLVQKPNAKGNTPHSIPMLPGLLGMSPAQDRLIGSGKNINGFVTQSMVPYFIHGEHCIVADALPFRLAFSLMVKLPYAELTADASDPEHPRIFIDQDGLYICFHLVHPGDGNEYFCEGCIHATPVLLKGEHVGKNLHLKMQP